ncbi:FG-GAP-like repeat-containing protein [Microbulbifer sp. 2201CG32-9]|uniref:FG-GAP-like repeat-containing protein n=1 Tax=Microbulbifer sp. 2201CG32-9 TaxID=3232309 RepID=UPI00345C5076
MAVSWASVSGAASYVLQEQKDSGSWVQVYAGTGTAKTVTGRSNGVYRYRVAAVENGITGSYRYSGYTTISRAPAVPTGLTVPTTSSTGSYTVSWSAVSGAENYQIEQSGSAGGTWTVTGTSKGFTQSADGSFSYRVRACSVYNSVTSCSGWTSKQSIAVAFPQLSAPATNTTGGFTVTYRAVPNSVATEVELRVHQDGSLVNTYTIGKSAGSRTVTVNSSGIYAISYWWQKEDDCLQQGQNGCTEPEPGIPWTSEGQISVSVSIPQPGTLSVPLSSTTGSYSVSWGAASSSPNEYQLQQRKDGGAWTTIYSGSALSKSVSSLTTGVYDYRVRSCYTGCSSYTSTKTITVVRTPGSISTPSTSTNGSIAISWASVTGAASYVLQEQKNSGSWVQVYAGGSASRTISGQSDGVYRYRVAAVENGITGSFRNSGDTIVSRAPAVPTGLTLPSSSSTGSYTVSWSAVSGAENYQIEQSGDASGTWTVTGTSKSFTQSADGSFSYRVRACSVYNNVTSCSGWTSKQSILISLPQLSAPANNTTGAFTVTYRAVPNSSATEIELRIHRNGTLVNTYAIGESAGSKAIVVNGSGSYTVSYWWQKEDDCLQQGLNGCTEPEPGIPWTSEGQISVSVSIPEPGTVSVPESSATGSYTVSWGATSVAPDHYELQERKNSGSWVTVYSGSATSKAISGNSDGNYAYRVRACYSGCSDFSPSASLIVNIPKLSIESINEGEVRVAWLGWSADRITLTRGTTEIYDSGWGYGGGAGSYTDTLTSSGSYSYTLRGWECLDSNVQTGGCAEPDVLGTRGPVLATVVLRPGTPTLSTSVTSSYTGDVALLSAGSGPVDQVRWQKRQVGQSWPVESSYSVAASTDFTVSDLTDGNWEFRSKHCNSAGCSLAWSNSLPATVWNQPIPSSPALQPLQNSGSDTVQLVWSDLSHELVYQYKIYQNGTLLKTISTGSQNPSPVTGTSLSLEDGVYNYYLVACNLRDCSLPGNTASTIVANTPGAPSAVHLSPQFSRNGSVDLNWASSAGNPVRYELIPGTAVSKDGPVSWDEAAVIAHTDLQNLTRSLTLADGFYAYKVRACNQVSSFSTCSADVQSEIVQVEISSLPVQVEVAPHQETAVAATDPSVLASDRVGVLGGEFRVSESGTANYTIPIATGPASGGSVPSINLSYSSNGGNGPLGMGWSIGGLSAIVGCRKTLEEDGINGSDFDRFCLDGRRLKLVSSGNYGDIGTEYRTALDSFTRVRIISSSVGDKAFEVYRKDGSVSYYGATADALRENLWAINEQRDSADNRIEFTYLNDSAIGEHLIDTIDYSGNGTDTLINSIQFNYDTSRSDKIYGYRFGENFAATRRLTSVVSLADSVELRRYNFGYETGTTGRLRLQDITECVGNNCRPPSVFTYADSDGDGLVAFPASPNIFHSGYEGGKFGDVNGDGLTDHVFIRYDGDGKRYLKVALSSGGGLIMQSDQMRIRSNEREEWHLIDYDDDGMDDVLHAPLGDNTNHWEVNLSEGSGFSSDDTPTTLTYEPGQSGRMYDFNGDGLPDFLKITAASGVYTGSSTPQATIREMQRNSSGGLSFKTSAMTRNLSVPISTPPGGFVGRYSRTTTVNIRDTDTVADFNGDGVADMTAIAVTRWTCTEQLIDCYNNIRSQTDNTFVVLLSSGTSSHTTKFSRSLSGSIDAAEQRVADLNGDGLADLLFRSNANSPWAIYHFNGKTFVSAGFLPAAVDEKIQLMDWDHDGLVDILYPNANDTTTPDYHRLYVLPNHSSGFGSGYSTDLALGINESDHRQFPIDLNGDGLPELVEVCANRDDVEDHCDDLPEVPHHNGKYVRIFKTVHTNHVNDSNKPIDTLVSVTNGFGVTTTIEYQRLNDTAANIYTRELGASALDYGNGSPVFDLYSPMFVVKRVTSDAPAANDDTNTVEALYHYAGARIQGGGRGFLGFESITTYDPQNQVKTTTHYRQDYPFIGMSEETAKVIEPNANDIDIPAACSGTGLTVISCSKNQLASMEPIAGKTLMPYIARAIDYSYELDGSLLGRVETETVYDSGDDTRYGNVSQLTLENYDSAGTLVQRQTTSHSYNNVVDSSRWHLARLSNSTVTTQRFGSLAAFAITRTADFAYDPVTGLLTDEWVQKDTSLSLHTHYEHDHFGNRIKTTLTDAQGNSRSSRVLYDAYGRYPLQQINALDQTQAWQQDLNAFGQPGRVLDISGVATHFAYSQFGEQYFEHHETGAHSTTLKALCADTGGCPTIAGVPAYFKVTTSGIDDTETLVYHDRLGREIRKQTQDFHGNAVYVDTQYDAQSRVHSLGALRRRHIAAVDGVQLRYPRPHHRHRRPPGPVRRQHRLWGPHHHRHQLWSDQGQRKQCTGRSGPDYRQYRRQSAIRLLRQRSAGAGACARQHGCANRGDRHGVRFAGPQDRPRRLGQGHLGVRLQRFWGTGQADWLQWTYCHDLRRPGAYGHTRRLQGPQPAELQPLVL